MENRKVEYWGQKTFGKRMIGKDPLTVFVHFLSLEGGDCVWYTFRDVYPTNSQ